MVFQWSISAQDCSVTNETSLLLLSAIAEMLSTLAVQLVTRNPWELLLNEHIYKGWTNVTCSSL